MRPILGSLFFLAAALTPLRAQAGLLVPTSTGRPDARVLSLREMAIDIGIARGYARVNVRQVFENHTAAIQEGTYRFALPASAAVGDFAIWDGLQRIPGVILEKKRARSIYQELTRQRIDPGLLQQGEEEDTGDGSSSRPSGGALFSVTVAPIPARATKRLELQFQEEVPFIDGVGEFRLVLRPPDGEAPVARHLTVKVTVTDGLFEPVAAGLPLSATSDGAAFTGDNVRLDRDLVLRIRPKGGEPLRLTAFRNPDGVLPDGLALAPWERPSEIPPEKDGFFLLEALLPAKAEARGGNGSKAGTLEVKRPSQSLAILFDTSLSHRWAGLETAYGHLVRVLQLLQAGDRFALIPYDRTPADGVRLRPATAQDIEAELTALRARALGPGANLGAAVGAARKLVGDQGRILLLTSGQGIPNSKALRKALGDAPLFAAVTVGEAGESLRAASTLVLSNTATEIEGDLFFKRLLAPPEAEVAASSLQEDHGVPFTVTGGDPKLRHIYPVLVQPMEPGSLSAWVGRYAVPQPKVRVELVSPLFKGGKQGLDGAFPEKAMEARDLPRRWARARVDDLLARIEAEGERREWVDEIIDLSKRYKFITPYTAFLAAPRSLLRPRRIQPGDPVLRVECDEGTVAATALFPFGLKLDLVRRPGSLVWEGRFLVPDGLKDGRYAVRILLRDRSGVRLSETKHFVLDGKAPDIQPQLPASARAGEVLRVEARADEDVVFLSARLGDGPPVPLRWDPMAKRSVGLLRIPADLHGGQEILFEAVDAAKNRGFARATVEVKP
ncbi:MAG TPA: VIT domain-containing protein [Geothrix sp.]|nr:VIT domain-containing protein [Geothrix sp.]